MRRVWTVVGMGVLLGCASIEKSKGHAELAQAVEERIGAKTGWHQGTPEQADIDARVASLLKDGLTLKAAVEIALVNNSELQATYEELGISQADMVQAGLLKNPTLGISTGFPLTRSGHFELEFSVVQEFLDLFMLPLRKKVAQEQFLLDVQRVAHQALEVAAECSKAFIEVQAKEQSLATRKLVTQSFDVALELALAQKQAGNIDDFQLLVHRTEFEKAQLELKGAELELAEAREALNRLLGLEGAQANWSLREALPALPVDEPVITNVEALVEKGRLDLAAARRHQAMLAHGLNLTKTWRWIGHFEIGAHMHQDPDGPQLLGPEFSLDLPIFDQRQALIARLEAENRQATRRLEGLRKQARSEARLALAKSGHARQVALRYRDTVLPAHEKLMDLSLRKYNAMLIGLYELLEHKNQQLEAALNYVDALRDYWAAQVEVTRALGGRVASAPPSGPQNAQSAPSEKKEEPRQPEKTEERHHHAH